MQRNDGRGIILDLRWCPVGYLSASQAVARSFLSHDKPIVLTQKRRQGGAPDTEDSIAERYPSTPLVVLINGETSGAGELIAASLQEYGRAMIAGERSFGKATIQERLLRNPLQINYRITSGQFLTPKSRQLDRYASGPSYDDWGVRPDAGRWLPLSPATSKQLKEWWTWHALRPTGSNEALPTDDIQIDPQLSAALQMLRQMTSKAKS